MPEIVLEKIEEAPELFIVLWVEEDGCQKKGFVFVVVDVLFEDGPFGFDIEGFLHLNSYVFECLLRKRV